MGKKLTKNELEQRIQELEREMAEYKRMEKVLQESRIAWAKAQEVACMGNWEWDIDADKITWSDELYRIYDLEHMKGRLTYDVLMERIHPDDREYHHRHTGNWLINRGGDPFEYRILRSDGSVRYLYGPGEVLCDDRGKPIKMFGVIQDITEHKRAEEVLRESEEQVRKLSHAVEQSPTAIMITDTTGNIEYVNPQFTWLTGYASEEVLGKNLVFFKSGEQPAEFYKQLWDTISSGKIWHGEFHNKKKNGELYWESASISPIMSEDNKITHYVAVKEDITDRKKTEEELRKAHEELEQRVKERTAELKQTFDQLLHAEKLSAIGKLSASIAHEFNNPLFGIRSVLEGIKKRGTFDKEDSELLDLGIRECNRIKDLIVSLQEFNRPTSGEMKPMNVQQAIEDMLLLCKKEFNTRKITVEECYTADLPEIQAVEDQIKQVILNLLRNAEEAIPEEGGIIRVATKRFKKKVAIQIHDSGVGIRAKDKNKIFDPFYSTKASVKGAGLGLSVSYGIIKRHGGGVEVESRPNKGTIFTVTLPMKGSV